MTTKATKTIDERRNARKLSTTPDTAASDSREQAEAYESLFAPTPLELENGEGTLMVPPHPDWGMLDDENMQAWDEYMFEIDTVYEREPDIHIPEQRLENGLTLPSDTQRGSLLVPYRKKNADDVVELVRPAHTIKVVQIALGDEEFDRLKRGGKQTADVYRIWRSQSLKIRERQAADSKSVGSAVDLEAVPETDSE